MEAWVQTLITAIVSGTIVGLIVASFKANMDKNAKNAERASDLRIDNVMNELGRVWSKLTGLESKVDVVNNTVITRVGSLDMKMAVVVSEHQHISKNLGSLEDRFEKLQRQNQDYGKVTVKP